MSSESTSKLDSRIIELAGKDRRKHLRRAVDKALAAAPPTVTPAKYGKSLSRSQWKEIASDIEATTDDTPSPEVLSSAAEAIREIIHSQDKRGVDLLISKLDSFPDDVRGTAKSALGELKAPGIFETLVKSFIDDIPELYADVARGLGKLGDRRATRSLLTLGTYWDDAHEAALSALAELGEVAIPELSSLVERRDKAALRPIACEALGRIGDSQAVPILANILKGDRRPAVRVIAAEALGKLDDRAVLGPLVAALKDDDDDVRVAAITALQSHRRKRIVPALVHVLNDPHPKVRELAARLLGNCGVNKAVAPLGVVVADPVPETRAAVLEAMAKLGDETAVPQLGAMLNESRANDDDELTVMLATSLGERQDSRAILPLLNAMPGTRPTVQSKVIAALGEIRDASVLPVLLDAMNQSSSPAVKVAAVSALGKIGTPAVLEPMNRALQAGPPLRQAAVSALGDVHLEEAVTTLADLLSDPDPNTRRLAAQALGQNGNESVFRKLRPLLEDTDTRVTDAARESLKQLGDAEVLNPPAVPKKAKKKKAKKPKKIKKSKQKASMPAFNWELIQSLNPGDLVTIAKSNMAVTGGILGTLALVVFGVVFVPSLLKMTFTGGLDSSIIVRGPLSDIALSPDGTKVAMAREAGVLDVFDLTTETVVVDKYGPAASRVLFGADSNTLFSASSGQAGRWDITTQEFQAADPFSVSAFNSDRSAAVTLKSLELQKYNLATGETTTLCKVPQPTAGAFPVSIAATPDLGKILIGFPKGDIVIYIAEKESFSFMNVGVKSPVQALDVSDDGSLLAIGLATGQIVVWRAGEAAIATIESEDINPVVATSFVENGGLLAVRTKDTLLVDAQTGATKQSFAPACGSADLMSTSADGSRVAFAKAEGKTIAIHNMSDGSLVKMIDVPDLAL